MRSRFSHESVSIWPGYVDVLSSLLMVVIFVLMIFTFAQFLMSYILSGQSSELQSLHARIARSRASLDSSDAKIRNWEVV